MLFSFKGKNIALITFLVLMLFTFKSFYFNETKFKVLNHMTKVNVIEYSIDEVVLVENPPKSSFKLKEMILSFNKNRLIDYKKINQLFIKEHDYKFLPEIVLDENYKYENNKTNKDKLDNIDFLAKREKSLDSNRVVVDKINCFTGNFCYYKK